MTNSRFSVKVNNLMTFMVVENETGRCLGAFGSNFYRSWVFPLYTPSGLTVLQEFPYDHPFHNGFFVGQHPVFVGEREGNYWIAPPRRNFKDPNYRNLGRVDAPEVPEMEIHDQGVRFRQENVWRDEHEEPLIDEVREVDFYTLEDATVCEMTSRKIATYGDVEYRSTKFGSIGLRAEPRLTPTYGGEIIADSNRRGDASLVMETDSGFVAYENRLPDKSIFGVFMTILAPQERGPWFVRDFGVMTYNPTMKKPIFTPQGKDWTIKMRVIAYDGPLTDERVHRWTSLHQG
ncbi:MAG: hypothetical protein JW384_00526 [Nitrosomonadaceae bacterium]|nr:hypothetical protein [Nitrosomonadaceae bacterium]